MFRKAVVLFFFSALICGSARAQSCGPLPNTLANGTNADATQVMANFNTLVNCINSASAIFSPQGRLTLQSGVPVMSTAQSAKTVMIYTPYTGNQLPLYDGTRMVATAFSELSVATSDTTKNPSPIGASKVNDWFVWNDGGTIRLSHGPDWTNDTTRSAGTALVQVNGVLLNSVAVTNGPGAQRGTYVGTTRSDGSSQLNWIPGGVSAGGTAALLYVWNYYNRVLAVANVSDATGNWQVAAGAIQAMDGSVNNRVSFVSGAAESSFVAQTIGMTKAGSGGFSGVAIGYDSTTAMSGNNYLAGYSNVSAGAFGAYSTIPLGAHFVQALDVNNGTSAATNYGNGLLTLYLQGGLLFNFMM
jgi:hypothetical protein